VCRNSIAHFPREVKLDKNRLNQEFSFSGLYFLEKLRYNCPTVGDDQNEQENNMETVTIIGKRGSWYADVDFIDGKETLPCLHKYFWKGRNLYVHHKTPRYDAEFDLVTQMIETIRRTGKAIVVNSDPTFDKAGEPIGWTRQTGNNAYVGVFGANVVTFDKTGFVIEFTHRIANPKKK
jgi:hypothetical protein